MGAIAKIIIILGVFLVVIGVILLFIGKVPFLGKLPGDVLIKKSILPFLSPHHEHHHQHPHKSHPLSHREAQVSDAPPVLEECLFAHYLTCNLSRLMI